MSEITWRATKLRTKTGNFVIVPNNVVGKEAIVNYSQPAAPSMIEVEVGASYLSSPGEVKTAVQKRSRIEAGADRTAARRARQGLCGLIDRLSRALLDRRLRAGRGGARRGSRRHLLAFRRTESRSLSDSGSIRSSGSHRRPREEIRGAPSCWPDSICSPGSPGRTRRLAEAARDRLFGDGERIVREGEPGSSLFVIGSGRVVILSGAGPSGPGREVATLDPGAYSVRCRC